MDNRKNFRYLGIELGMFLAMLPQALLAVDNVWTNSAGGVWEDAPSWSQNSVPDATDTVKVGNNGTYTVTVGNSAANSVPNSFTNSGLSVHGYTGGNPTLDLTYTNAINFRVNGILDIGNGTLNMSAPNADLSSSSHLFMGVSNPGGTGTLNATAGSVTIGGLLLIGDSPGALSTINVYTGATFTALASGHRVGGDTSGTAIMNILGGSVTLGGGTLGFASNTVGRIVMTSGQLALNAASDIFRLGGAYATGEMDLYGGNFSQPGAMSMEVGSGTSNGHGIIKVFGGSHTNGGGFFLGTRTGTTGEFFVGGGSWTIMSPWNVGEPDAVGRITVTNGLLQVPVVQIPIFLGHGAGGYGELNVNGGTVSLGDWGTANGPRVLVGAAASATGFVHVTSGTFQLLNEGGGGLIVGTNASSSGLVVLDGGLTQLRNLNIGPNGILSNRTGAVLQFLTDPLFGQVPGIIGSGAKIVDGGTLSYKGFSAVDVVSAVSQYSVVSGSGLQLDSSTNVNITGTYTLTNAANNIKTLSLTGTKPRWNSDNLEIASGGMLHVTNATSASVASIVNNSGNIRLQSASAVFEQNVTVAPSGTLQGGAGDTFEFKKSLLIQSTNNTGFDLRLSDVKFSGGGNHTNLITGRDFGTNAFYAADNFGYGGLHLGVGGPSGDQIYFGSGDGASSNALYSQWVDLLNLTNNVANLHTLSPNINIYYMLSANDPRNAYLMDQTYILDGGGLLLPAVPEPSVVALLVLAGLLVQRRPSR